MSITLLCNVFILYGRKINVIVGVMLLRRNPIEDRAISGFSGQKSVPE